MFDVTITADTPGELRDKIKALAELMTGTAMVIDHFPAPVEDAPDATVAVKPKATPVKPKATPAKEVVDKAPVEEPVKQAKLLDFNTEVAPTVIDMVEKHGKPFVAGVLERFGVAKASEMSPPLWPELLVALNEASEAL